MPIRYVDKAARLGRIAATLDDITAVMVGTNVSPENRTGIIRGQFEQVTSSIAGFFTPAAGRTGTITATFNPVTASVSGTHVPPVSAPVWQSGTINVPLTVGTAADIDIASYVTGEQSIEVLSGSVPGMTYTPKTMRLAGTPTTAGTHVVSFRADDTVPGGDAAADWATRISGPGVVWYHNFDTAAEVNAFRWAGGYGGGNDPAAAAPNQCVTWVPSGGADGGGYMQLLRPAGAAGPLVDGRYWWRPFSPLTGASNGRGQDDPAAGGTLTLGTYIATNGGSQGLTWAQASNAKPGWYGHPADATSFYDGTEFYVQVRVMVDPRRTTPGNISVGKFTSFTNSNDSYTNQELVTYAGYWEGSMSVGMPNIHNVYQGYNYAPLSQVSTGQQNPISPKWAYSGGWDTLLYHVTPGRNGVNETRFEVWAAKQGETAYTKIWDCIYPAYYDGGQNTSGGVNRPGWNAMLCWIYHNGAQMSEFWQRFDQIIFSKQTIPCPQV